MLNNDEIAALEQESDELECMLSAIITNARRAQHETF